MCGFRTLNNRFVWLLTAHFREELLKMSSTAALLMPLANTCCHIYWMNTWSSLAIALFSNSVNFLDTIYFPFIHHERNASHLVGLYRFREAGNSLITKLRVPMLARRIFVSLYTDYFLSQRNGLSRRIQGFLNEMVQPEATWNLHIDHSNASDVGSLEYLS